MSSIINNGIMEAAATAYRNSRLQDSDPKACPSLRAPYNGPYPDCEVLKVRATTDDVGCATEAPSSSSSSSSYDHHRMLTMDHMLCLPPEFRVLQHSLCHAPSHRGFEGTESIQSDPHCAVHS